MKQIKVIVSVFLALWQSEEMTTQNVTFYNINKSWKDAVYHCALQGGVLESNVTLLREQTEIQNSDEGVWIGKFTTLTNWTYIRGCYLINENFQHFQLELSNSVELQCQMLCNEFKFYSIKGEDCFCIDDIHSFVRSNNCNCVGCYKVWEHGLPDFGTTDRKDRCIATDGCDSGKLRRSYENCNYNFYVNCGNNNFGILVLFNDIKIMMQNLDIVTQTTRRPQKNVKDKALFIKWYSDSLCDSPGIQRKHWTSGTRHDETFCIRKSWTDEDKGDVISIPNLSIVPQNNAEFDDWGSIAAGIITSTIVLTVSILLIRLQFVSDYQKEKQTIHKSQNPCPVQDLDELHINNDTFQTAVDHDIDVGNDSPPYEILSRHPAVNSTYDCLNVNCTPESENVYINTNKSAISTSDFNETDSKLHEQNQRVKQKN
ncbi:unnamed protein product [Mytilus edulis]|uniref:C-type lectin domain-containing protein n=1 Tax=Mytilus edulis TaxID=6550 RepID=A0A8S3SUQ0_MYTED|nr:unnamed protein product [Mytilus edulis]